MWHVSSRSSVATLRTAIHLLLTYLLTSGGEVSKGANVRSCNGVGQIPSWMEEFPTLQHTSATVGGLDDDVTDHLPSPPKKKYFPGNRAQLISGSAYWSLSAFKTSEVNDILETSGRY